MSQYDADATDAQADLADAGAAVTFARDTPGVYDAATDTTTGAAVTTARSVAVAASTPELFAQLQSAGEVLRNPITLYVGVPELSTFTPTPGDRVTFGGVTRRVVSVNNTAPDGTSLLYEIVAST